MILPFMVEEANILVLTVQNPSFSYAKLSWIFQNKYNFPTPKYKMARNVMSTNLLIVFWIYCENGID